MAGRDDLSSMASHVGWDVVVVIVLVLSTSACPTSLVVALGTQALPLAFTMLPGLHTALLPVLHTVPVVVCVVTPGWHA